MGEKRLTVSPPAVMTLEQAKRHVRAIGFTQDDDLINEIIVSATESIESFTRRAIPQQQWAFTFTSWSSPLVLGRGNLLSVDSITYVDVDNVEQTLAATNYIVVDDDDTQGQVYLDCSVMDSWPDLSTTHPQPVKVTATVGYNEVPKDLLQAIKMEMSHFYENRETVVVGASATEIPQGAKHKAWKYQVPLFR